MFETSQQIVVSLQISLDFDKVWIIVKFTNKIVFTVLQFNLSLSESDICLN